MHVLLLYSNCDTDGTQKQAVADWHTVSFYWLLQTLMCKEGLSGSLEKHNPKINVKVQSSLAHKSQPQYTSVQDIIDSSPEIAESS